MIHQYLNGNYIVTIDNEVGTKSYRALRIGEELISDFPDSIDLKITNKCSIGCPYCHESSTLNGKSFNLEKTIQLLSELPKGVEIAIGGGDVLEPSVVNDFVNLMNWLNDNDYLPRATLNIESIRKYIKIEENGFGIITNDRVRLNGSNKCLGISISKFDKKDFKLVEDNCIDTFDTLNILVYHVIAGLFPLEDLEKLLESSKRVLILGYKSWGRGKNITPPVSLKETSDIVKRHIFKLRTGYDRYRFLDEKNVLAFDNLAIEQLEIRDCFTEYEWNRLYMGDEFTHTMYVDAVNEEFAPTSRDPRRESWSNYPGGIIEYFKKNKKC